MNKVYTVFFSETYGDYGLIGVYSSKKKAELEIENAMKEYHGGDDITKYEKWDRANLSEISELIEDEYILTECELDNDINEAMR